MVNRLVIYMDMTPHARVPYRIADVFHTLDGPMTRLSHKCFASLEEAHAFVMKQEEKGGAYHGD